MRAALANGLTAYFFSGLIVALGVICGVDLCREPVLLRPPRMIPPSGSPYLDALTSWDGQWYLKIVNEGYSFEYHGLSTPAFFPLYPWAAQELVDLTGIEPAWALLIVSHGSLAGAFVLLFLYVRSRYPQAPPALATFVLLAFGLFPTTFFARMAYSESSFLLVSILAVYGMQRNWHLGILAGLVGLCTAARPVGVALLLPLAIHAWERAGPGSRWLAVRQMACWAPVALWGLLVYAAYLGAAFGKPLAFLEAQQRWNFARHVSGPEHLGILVTLEPFWSTYVPSSPNYWRLFGDNPNPLCSLQFANPIFVALGVGLLIVGWRKRWLSRQEIALGACLLLIPYVLRSHEMSMQSQGRFVGVVFPIYLVLGNLFQRSPLLVAMGVLGISSCCLALYSAMFAAGYLFI